MAKTKKVSWKHFERIVAAIHYTESKGAAVVWNDIINGRQFDVSIRFKYGLHDYLTVIECKNYSKKVPVEKIDAFATKARDANANKAIVVSSSGFQSGCFQVASRHGIKLLTLNEKTETDIKELIADVTPALNIYSVKLKISNSSQYYELEDVGGRLHYLMNNITIKSETTSKSLNQIVYEWQLSLPNLSIDNENSIVIPFLGNATAVFPNAEPLKIDSMLFKCKFVEAFIPKFPVLDNYIREELNTGYELIDESGNIIHSIDQSELKIGFDTQLEVGKFYEIPKLHNSYYCEKIENGIVSWVLVESYQHGHLIQARFTQKVEYSCYYVEITDKKRISNLRLLLKKLKR